MADCMTSLQVLWHDESGQDLLEYALILGCISLVAVAALRLYATNGVLAVFSGVGSTLTSTF